MKLTTAKMAEALKIESELWEIELIELGADQAFNGYSLTGTYLLVGITSPIQENQVSINSMPEEKREMVIPITFENCDNYLSGQVFFKGLDKITKKWDVFFTDRRFDEIVKVESSSPIAIKIAKNTRSEQLKWIGFTKNKGSRNCFFELKLKPKMYLK